MVLFIPNMAEVAPTIHPAEIGSIHAGNKVLLLPCGRRYWHSATLQPGRLAIVTRVAAGGLTVTNLTRGVTATVPFEAVAHYRPAMRPGEIALVFGESYPPIEIEVEIATSPDNATVRGHAINRESARSERYSNWVKRAQRRVEEPVAYVLPEPAPPELPKYWRDRVESIAKQYAEDHGMCQVVDDALAEIFLPLKGWRVSSVSDSEGQYMVLDEDGQICAYNEDREELVRLVEVLNKAAS